MTLSKRNPFSDLIPKENMVDNEIDQDALMTNKALTKGKNANKKLMAPLLEKIESIDTEKTKITKIKNNPFMDLIPKQENKLDPSVLNRVPGALKQVGSDVLSGLAAAPKAIVEKLGNIPKDIDYLKENIPAAKELIMKEPVSASKFAIAGLADIGHGVLNSPSALANYLAKIGMIEKGTANIVPKQKDISSELSNFTGEKPGGQLIRGTFRNIPSIAGVGKGLQAINPMKLTSSNIAKNVIKKEELQKGLHNKMYNKIWNKAQVSGVNKVPYDPNKIDLTTIKKYSTERYNGALDKFVKDPTLENAQKAQSDLGKLVREFDKKATLTSEERSTYKAAKDAQENIKDNMFKDKNGKLDTKLKKEYDKVTKSYGENVIPYSANKSIQEFKRKDITKEQLIQRISKGKFSAKKGTEHPEIKRREMVKSLLKSAGYVGGIGLLGGAAGASMALINKLLGKN